MQKIDLLIKNGLVLDFEQKTEVKDVAIDDGKIIAVGKDLKNYDPLKVIEAQNKIVVPGFANTHTHAGMSYFKGLADDLPLMKWLTKFIWPTEKAFLSPKFVYDAALIGCAEMVKNGITIFNDMYFFGEQTAKAAEKVGIRAILGEGVLDAPVANYQKADEIFSYIKKMNEKFKEHELIDFAIAPHAIYTCGKENLIKAKDLAEKLDLLLHIHLSETRQEVEDCIKKHGMRPAQYLNSFGFFEGKVIAAHAIWLDEKEQEILANNDVSIAINTSSNLKLASGFDSFKSYIDHNVNLSIATDSVASNNNLSIIEEMSLTAKLQKVLNDDPTVLPAKQMVKIATLDGAKALDKSAYLGSIQIGKKADLILVDIDNIESQPLYDPFSHLVYSLSSEQIKDVIINGKMIMENRKLLNVDENELIEKARYYHDRIEKFTSS